MKVVVLPFNPAEVPYQYKYRLGERTFTFRWEWNFVAGWFRLVILDENGDLVWTRPVLWGTDLLFGCTVPGLSDYVLVPGDPAGVLRDGITWNNAELARMYLWPRKGFGSAS